MIEVCAGTLLGVLVTEEQLSALVATKKLEFTVRTHDRIPGLSFFSFEES